MEEEVPEPPPADERFRCPGCHEEVDVPPEGVGHRVRCPYCSTEFFAAVGRTDAAVIDDMPAPPEPGPDGPDLDAIRVRQLSALRLDLLRTRSWWMMGVLFMAVVATNLWTNSARAVWVDHAWNRWTLLEMAAGGLAAALAGVAARQARRLAREVARSRLADPAEPPDFSTLAAAPEPWQRLNDVR